MIRDELISWRNKVEQEHAARIKAIDALLSLVDESGNMPEAVVSMISALANRSPVAAPTPQAFSSSILDDAIVAYFERYTAESEWTSASVRDGLEASGYQLPGTTREATMNAIGLALGRLVDAGRITRFYEGRGRDPHRYRRVLTAEEVFGPAKQIEMVEVNGQRVAEATL